MKEGSRGGLWGVLGPGLLFAAAAVGVSHLVQSTRAGAVYGMAMLAFILLANAAKYPAFRFGPHYAAATGTSLLEGYRRQGVWALVLYTVLTFGTMFTVQAAVTVVTAGLVQATLGVAFEPIVLGPLSLSPPVAISAAILAVCATLLVVGHYAWLDRITKVLVGILTVATLAATIMVLPKVPWGSWGFGEGGFDKKTILFVAALVGWMPSAIDVAVWQSLWTLAKARTSGHKPTVKESMLDFHVGYIGTAVLAICFMLLGAGVMHASGVEFKTSAGGFAAQIIGLYRETLGDWSGPLIGVAAFFVMFSTTLTVLDGFPRALSALWFRYKGPEDPERPEVDEGRRVYWISMAVLAVGSVLVLAVFLQNLKAMVDIATTLSFLTAPMLAILNHRAITSDAVPEEARPKPWLVVMSWVGIVSLSLFAVYYMYLRFLSS